TGGPVWRQTLSSPAPSELERAAAGLGLDSSFAFPVCIGTEVTCILEFFSAGLMEPGPALLETIGQVATQLSRVAERQRASNELAAARDSAMASSRLKSDFLATMSHEIRTPMNGVIGLTGLLLTTELDVRQRQYAEGVQTAGEALLAIINDILDLSKIEAGRLELEMIDFDLVQVVEEAAGLVAEAAQRKGLELVAFCAPDLPDTVRGDPARLRQVLLNLASNAVKFTPTGEVVIRAEMVGGSADLVTVRFEVVDTGIGISEADGERLFEPFSQADASTTRRFGGTGLGLAISRRLVATMEGDLGFESTPGVGTIFGFTLPFERRAASNVASPLAPPAQEMRVLVVDDNRTSRGFLADQLRAWGVASDSAPDGSTALTLLHEASGAGRPYDVALVDDRMPGMDGFELSGWISSDSTLAATRLVLLTSTAGISSADYRQFGIATCLTKPVRLSHLAGALVPADPASSRPVAARRIPPSGSTGHVLVVEDNANNQLVAMGILRHLGYRADVAANGFEALAALDRTSYDAILMDCQMPEMDGFTATGEIRLRQGTDCHTPVIAMTAGASDADRERCLDAGMDDFLAKPVRPGDVEAVLARWVPAHYGSEATPPAPAAAELESAPPPPVTTRVLDEDLLEEICEIGPEGMLLTQLITTFVGATPRYLAELGDLVARDNAPGVVQVAHRMRGTAGTVGALEVTMLVAQLEENASDGRLDGAETLLGHIHVAFDRAAAALSHRSVAGGPAPDPSPPGPTPTWDPDGDLELLPEPALRLDATGRLLGANRLAFTTCASTRGSPTAMAEAVMEVPGFASWLRRSDGDAFRGRLQCLRENGVPLTLEVSARRLPGEAGGVTCLLLEFDRARVATEAQRYFDVAFDAAPIGMALFNTDGEYVRVNRSICDLLGRSEAQLLGHRDQEFTHPDDRQRDVDAAWRILSGEISTWQCEKRFVRGDGSVVWAIANLTFLRDTDGNPVSWVGQFQDITARQALETGLRDRERHTRQIIDTANEAFVSIDDRGLITDWNPRSEAMFGWPRDEALGRSFTGTLVREPDRVACDEGFRRFAETGQAFLLDGLSDMRMIHRDGHGLQIEVTLSALQTDSGYRANAFLRDISERRRVEDQLTQAHTNAVAASRMKSEFVANMSHEIRTPLNGVIGMTGLLLGTDLSDQQREYVDAAGASADALLRVIDDVLDFAKIESGRLELESEPFDVGDLVADVSMIVAPSAHAKGVDLAFWVDHTVPTAVRGDANRVRQVLSNLMSNAVKFTSDGEVVVEARGSTDGAGTVALRVEVRDTGIGIEPAALSRIFDSFSQADGSTTRRFGGTGLGLTISKQLVGLMAGTIGVESVPGGGSTFWFSVPLLVDTPVTSGGDAGPTLVPGVRILVVGRPTASRTFLERQLRGWEATCTSTNGGRDGLEELASAATAGTPYDVCLVDSMLDDMTGAAFAGSVKASPELGATRLVLLTSASRDREASRAVGIDAFLATPVRVSRLHDTLGAILAKGASPAPMGVTAGRPVPPRRERGSRGAVLVVEDNLINQLVAVSLLELRGFTVDVAGNGREALDRHAGRSYR
ncbi:MAG: hypothetical protein QOE93_687, partial [Actinomycetota bacterium]|nr:hypothetical protein [Actinomycetota bacterium]